MNRFKSSISVFLVVVLLLSVGINAFAEDKKKNLDDMDKLLIAQRFMTSSDENVDLWKGIESVKEVVDLYDVEDNVIAYYISFNPKGYVIVNNNLDNPIAIEFGDGDNQSIKKLLGNQKGEKICYAGPGESFIKDDLFNGLTKSEEKEIKSKLKLDKIYAKLAEKNSKEKEIHEKRYAYLKNNKALLIGGSSSMTNAFVAISDMPSGQYTHDEIPYGDTTWAVMEDYELIANDHCGATAATNIALYYAERGYTDLKKNDSIDDTFTDLHLRIGDGPAPFIASDLKDYATDQGYTMTSSLVGTYSGLKTATLNNKACGVLVTTAINEWHWIVSVGWREYDTGASYIRIVNGWDDSVDNFSLWGDPTVWSITKYTMQ